MPTDATAQPTSPLQPGGAPERVEVDAELAQAAEVAQAEGAADGGRSWRPGRRTAVLAATAAVLAVGGAVTAVAVTGGDEAAAAPARGAPAVAPEGEAVPPRTPDAAAAPASDVRVTIDEVGLDLPVLPLTPSGGAIDPPTNTEAYFIAPYGQPVGDVDDSVNTLYIAAHSSPRGGAAFDPLLAGDRRGSALGAGDVVEVTTPQGTVEYTVERTQRYDKDSLADATEVWAVDPGRLVLITCFQRADGRRSTENLVVFADA